MRLPNSSANQSAPSGPAVMCAGRLPVLGSTNSVKMPDVVTRPILEDSVNHRSPPGPLVMPQRTGIEPSARGTRSRLRLA